MEEIPQWSSNQFDIQRLIGKGPSSTVQYALYKKTMSPFAIKTVNKMSNRHSKTGGSTTTEFLAAGNEAMILKELSYISIVKFYGTFSSSGTGEDSISLVLEYIDGEELHDKIEGTFLYEKVAINYFKQLLGAVAYLHFNSIVHRDIKPSNILVDSRNQIKLIDFGFAVVFHQNDKPLQALCGTAEFLAPEIILLGMPQLTSISAVSSNREPGYGAGVDMWSLGVTLYMMLSGRLPFNAGTYEELYRKIVLAKVDYTSLDASGSKKPLTSANTIQLIQLLLHADPQKRLTAHEAMKKLI